MLKNKVIKTNIYIFALIFSSLNILLYDSPLFKYILSNLSISSYDGIMILIGVLLSELYLGYLFIILISFIPFFTKPIIALSFICNSIALYFINSYNVILDKTMMGNVINTNTEESLDLYSYKLILYIIFLGIIPSILILRIKIIKKRSFKKFITFTFAPVLIVLCFFYINSSTWLWLDKNLKILGALSMPFSYSINALRYQIPLWTTNQKQIDLPRGHFVSDKKVVVVLVIGESARAENFSLYGYKTRTNPKLESLKDVVAFPNSTSCATYTTAGVKCILSHLGAKSYGISKNYEYLPTYLKKHDIKVFWLTNNAGEPKIEVDSYQKRSDIHSLCTDDLCKNNSYDDILLYKLNDLIKENINSNTFIVLHQTGSHGPSYYNKYPKQFEKFTPVCKSVEIKENCSQKDLINAYDNTILYTDDFLYNTIAILKSFKGTPSVMLYISDHGESLGEDNVYLHGMPNFIAPAVQRSVPFLMWMSDDFKKLRNIDIEKLSKNSSYSQDNIFYSVMGAFGLNSDFYNPHLDVFSNK